MDVEVVENVLINKDEELAENNKELERSFQSELENLKYSILLHMEPREKLPKLTMSDEIQERTNKILRLYLPRADIIPEITDITYAMKKAIGYATGIKPSGNRKERKLKAGMNELRQDIARAGNELYRQKQQRKSTKKKEKRMMKELGTKMNGKEVHRKT